MKRVLPFLALLFGVLLAGCAGMMTEAAQREEARARLARADAMFQERCKKAGEFIHRTAENVEGIFLLKLRVGTNYRDQYRMDDPYGRDLDGEGYIQTFVRGFETRQAQFAPGAPNRFGYLYVDAIDPKDGKRYRYTGRIEEPWQTNKSYLKGYTRFVLDKTPAPNPAPRYGVMAERIGYMMARGQGSASGGRAPWLMAASNACPAFTPSQARQPGFSYQVDQTRKFVEKVIRPSQER